MCLWYNQTSYFVYVPAFLVFTAMWAFFLFWIVYPASEGRPLLTNPWSKGKDPISVETQDIHDPLIVVTKRRVGYYHARSPLMTGQLANPCKTNGTGNTKELYYCYQNNRTLASVIFDKTKFSIGGWSAHDWNGYAWYLDSTGYKQVGHNWKDVFSTTDNTWSSSSYGTSDMAKRWKGRIKITDTAQSLILDVNTTTVPFDKPIGIGQYPNPLCHAIALCVWRPHYTDPCVTVSFCPNLTTTALLPTITKGPKSKSPIQSKIMTNPTVDDWFKVITGISRVNNNWLVMAEQAANASATDCIICMGPRPLLRVVPAPMVPHCLVSVMNVSVPTGQCSVYDSVYPLTGKENEKPIFSYHIARQNFTCINITGFKSIGRVPVDFCNCTVKVPATFNPLSRSDIWWWCGTEQIY
ncbi:uncharacterized protein LOC106510824, partial [Austrofundulus limnaeus]|uniref:Uncharacterized protein LOC106510824 n=1 Tax=Austrofundulus limnaeus TaxID=52670 RepID=A0A2I4AHN0_AUSLI